MARQEHLVHACDWDVLVILDACRYDLFKKYHSDYLTGQLYWCWSPGDGTIQWLQKTWPGKYDINYFSGNPTIGTKEFRKTGWRGYEHFTRIHDLFITHWCNKCHTVLPYSTTKAFIEAGCPTPAIVHYMQPHYPYVGEGVSFELPKEILDLDPKEYTLGRNKWIVENNKIADMRKSYVISLRVVLGAVKKLIENVDGKVIITSDHGERLGEEGHFFHTDGAINHPVLRTVPWFIVDSRK